MTHWAEPGVECVCINPDFNGLLTVNGWTVPHRLPVLNEILTVSSVRLLGDEIYLTFKEIPVDQTAGGLTGYDITWKADCFRPLRKRKTDISVFKAMLTPTGRVPVDA